MKSDGLTLLSGSPAVTNITVENGTTLPAAVAGNKGRLFYLTQTDGSNSPGLYTSDGSAWVTGDISAVVAGTGLTGGGTAGTVTLNVDTNVIATKSYVDSASGSGLPTTGGTMTGSIVMSTGTHVTLPDAPSSGNYAANKTYVDTQDATLVAKSGATMTGNLVVSTGARVTLTDSPVNGTDAVNKNYVDAIAANISWKQSVRAATTGNITLSGTQTVDGVSLIAGDSVLVKNQSTASANGIYLVASGAWTRRSDADTAAKNNAASMYVTEGTTNADTAWVLTTDNVTLGTTSLVFAQFNGGASYVAGTGLSLTGNTFDVNLGAGIAQLPTDEVGIDIYSGGGLMLTVDGTTTSTATGAQLALAASGATAGDYTKVTVDAKGRVTAGSNPTTLAGYGITDAISSSGGSVSGDTSFSGNVSIGTAGDANFSQVGTLMHFDGANNGTTFTDSASTPLTYTRMGSAVTSTAKYKFGTASLAMNADADYIQTSSNAPAIISNLSSNNFTIECQVYITSNLTGAMVLILGQCWQGSSSNKGWQLELQAGNVIEFAWTTNGSTNQSMNSVTGITAGAWHHIAVIRNGSSLTIAVDGVANGTGSISGSIFNSANPLQIGGTLNVTGNPCYIDEFRVTNGTARYSTPFTAPTTPFTTGSSTGGLTVLGSSVLTGNQTITLSGDVTGSGTTAITTALSTTGVSAGTYNSVTVDTKGRVTAGTSNSYITGNQSITVSGDASGTGTTAIALTLANSGVSAATYGSSTQLHSVTVDAKGRVTSASNIAIPYDIASSVIGKPANGDIVMMFIAPRAFTFPANMTGSYFTAATAATGSSAFTIAKNGSTFCTVTFAASGTTATFGSSAQTSFAAGDLLQITAPGTADATLANIRWTLAATMG